MSPQSTKLFSKFGRSEFRPYLEQVKGRTYCIVTDYARIPVYKIDERSVIMLDSGLPQSWEAIRQLLEQQALKVVAVMTSHAHPDHVGNHLNLRRHFGAKIYMSPLAATVYTDPMNLTAVFSGVGSYRRLREVMGEPFEADCIIDTKAGTIDVEGIPFGIEYLPGHAAEHIGIVTPDNVAYLGDTVLDEKMLRILRLPYCTCIEPDLESKEKIAQMQYDRYILAHNGVYDEIRELALLNRDSMIRKAAMIEELCDDYITVDGMVKKLLLATDGDVSSHRTVSGARRNVATFVDYLEDMDRLICRVRNGALEYIKKK